MSDKPSILYVDDERANLTAFEYQFEPWYEIHTATSGEEALDLLERHDIQVVITDQRMPEMSGTELLERVHRTHPDTIRMVLTGHSDIDAVIDAINRGRAVHYFHKPWDETLLRVTIDNALEMRWLQEAVRISEASLSRAQQIAGIGSWRLDIRGDALDWSVQTSRLFGVAPGTVRRYEDFLEFVHPDDRDRIDRAWQDALTGSPYDVEHRIVVNGEVRWIAQIADLEYEGDRPSFAIGTVQDVTERRRAEQTIRAERDLAELTVNSLPGVFYLFDVDGRLKRWNDNLSRLTGYTHDEIAGMHVSLFPAEESAEAVLAAIEQAFTDGRSRVEAKFVTKGGDKVPFIFNASKIDIDGVPHLVGMGVEISDRLAAEEALRQSERLLDSIIDNSSAAIYAKDREGRYLLVNRYFEKLVGRARPDILGATDDTLFPPHIAEGFRTNDAKVFETDQELQFEEVARHADGSDHTYVSLKVPLRSEDGSTYAVCGISTDVTDREQAQEKLRRSQERLVEAQRLAQVGNWELDLTTGRIAWSDEVFRIFGLPPQSIVPTYDAFLEAIHPDDRDLVNDAYSQSVKDRTPYEAVHRIALPDGELRMVRELGRSDYDESGAPIRSIGTVQDITEIWRAEQEARHAMRRKDEFVETTRDAVSRWKVPAAFDSDLPMSEQAAVLMDSVCVDANTAAWESTGFARREDFVGKPIRQLVEGLPYQEAIERFLREGYNLEDHEVCVTTTAGQQAWLLESWRGFFEDGQLSYLWASTKDISDLKQAEQAIRTERDLADRIVDSVPGAFFLVNEEHELVRWNTEMEQITGYSAAEIRDMRSLDFFAEEHIDVIQEVRARSLAEGSVVQEVPFVHKDGRSVPFLFHGSLIDIDGSLHLLGIGIDISDRVRAEKEIHRLNEELEDRVEQRTRELQVSEEKFRGLVETTSDWIWEVDAEGRYTYASPRIRDLLGYEPEEIIGKSPFDLMSPPEAKRVGEEFARIVEERTSFHGLENRNRHRDGSLRVLDTSGVPILGPDGALLGYRGVDRDVTERWAAEEKMRTLSRAIEASPATVVVTNVDGNIEYVNPKFTEVTGYAAEEILGENPSILQSGEVPRSQYEDLWDTITEGREWRGEFQNCRKNGEIFWEMASISPVKGSAGEITHFVAVKEDITERKEMEGRLQEAEYRYQTLLDSAPVGVWNAGPDGTGSYINPRAIEIMGVAPEMAQGDGWASALHPEDAGRVYAAWTAFVEGREPYDLTYRFVHADGSVRWVSAMARQVHDEDHELVGFIGVMTDITEPTEIRLELEQHKEHLEDLVAERTTQLERTALSLQQAKEEAEAASQAKSAFLANMSHEIRTPLNAVLGYAQLLQRDPTIQEPQHTQVSTIHRSGAHLLSLINDVLEMSRIEAGRVELTPTTFDLPRLLEEVQQMFAEATDSKGIGMTFHLDPDLRGTIIADPAKVRQVLINMLSNAVKFTDTGRIDLHAYSSPLEDERDRFTIEVEDTGCGIEPDQLDRVFDAFEQTAAGASKGGTGLGMAISRQFARLMGGDLVAESTPGTGATFTFTFEARAGLAADLAETSLCLVPKGLTPTDGHPRVLIVDDNRTNRALLDTILSSTGFQTREAASGEEAVDQHAAWRPDLILMDIRMPGMGGLEATRRLRAAGSQVSIIAISASVSGDARSQAVEAGADGFVPKPHTEADLFSEIGEVLELEYEYADERSVDRPLWTSDGESPLSDTVADLPPALVEQMRAATVAADLDRLAELIDEFADRSPDLARRLRRLADNFEYEALRAAFAMGDER